MLQLFLLILCITLFKQTRNPLLKYTIVLNSTNNCIFKQHNPQKIYLIHRSYLNISDEVKFTILILFSITHGTDSPQHKPSPGYFNFQTEERTERLFWFYVKALSYVFEAPK